MSDRHPILKKDFHARDNDLRQYYVYLNSSLMLDVHADHSFSVIIPTEYEVYSYLRKYDEFDVTDFIVLQNENDS